MRKETDTSEVTISFGTIFIHKENPDRIYVIIDTSGERGSLDALPLKTDESGRVYLSGLGGTLLPSDIDRIIGVMPEQMVVTAFIRGREKMGIVFDDKWESLIMEASRHGPYNMRISR